MNEFFSGVEIFRDAKFLRDLTVALLAGACGIAFLLRLRALEKRIRSLEKSLGAFALLGAGDSEDPLEDVQVLHHLEAMTEDQLEKLKTSHDKAPKSAKEP